MLAATQRRQDSATSSQLQRQTKWGLLPSDFELKERITRIPKYSTIRHDDDVNNSFCDRLRQKLLDEDRKNEERMLKHKIRVQKSLQRQSLEKAIMLKQMGENSKASKKPTALFQNGIYLRTKELDEETFPDLVEKS